MGNDHSRHHHHHGEKSKESSTTEANQNQPPAPAKDTTAQAKVTVDTSAPPPPPVPEQCDVLLTCANNEDDISLATFVKGGIEKASIPLYSVANKSKEEAAAAAKLLVDTKVLVIVLSEASSTCNKCQDQVSLAYISNKPIIVVAREPKAKILGGFAVGMKLTLDSLRWFLFEKEEEKDEILMQFVQLVQEQLSPKDRTQSTAEASAPVTRHVRLNTKLRAQSTVRDLGGEEPHIDTFWDRNFSDLSDVPWFKFQNAFLTDYEAQLSSLFDEKNIPWLLDMLKDDVFSGEETITKGKFMEVRGDSPDKNAFWRVISQVAIEKFNMREVFNMHSTVRLTAIEKLAAFQNPAVIEALLRLLNDSDPNVRAVAAISLGRTGTSTEVVVDRLIALLRDGDRIVRQSACLSLGTLKAKKAIPAIGNIWRNDFISVVRNAARTALENMDIPEAKEVLQVTKVLEEEIESLAGKQVAV